jgi:hypothetical protein
MAIVINPPTVRSIFPAGLSTLLGTAWLGLLPATPTHAVSAGSNGKIVLTGYRDGSVDINCNAVVNAQNVTLFRQRLGSPPGPSGVAP